MTPAPSLPIEAVRQDLLHHLEKSGRVILQASTGSGKTTQVPQWLWRNSGVQGQVVVLQPRRLAARLVARRVAEEAGVKPGEEVGFQTRFERACGGKTKILFSTEGLFLRQLQASPLLEGIGAVVLDEFHERSLQADFSLALLKLVHETRRPDLKLVVMSATLETALLADYLKAPVLQAPQRIHPVEIEYLPRHRAGPPWELAAAAAAGLLEREPEGDVLVFMPGAYEIRRTVEAIRQKAREPGLQVLPLHAQLSIAEQDEAVKSGPQRRVIVATNVAETSITIPGVRHVIDSGLVRMHRYDSRRGLNTLWIEPVSQASADQRAGRAGRLGPGRCLRLWTAGEHKHRAVSTDPEIARLDFAETLLQLKSLGVRAMRDLAWLEMPSDQAVQQAQELLGRLDAVDASGAVTATGRRMADLPLHPRLSRFLIEAESRGVAARAAVWAALISERAIFSGAGPGRFRDAAHADWPSDLVVAEAALSWSQSRSFDSAACAQAGVNAAAAREAARAADQIMRQMKTGGRRDLPEGSTEILLRALLRGFPDHLARRLKPDAPECALALARRAVLDTHSAVKGGEILLVLDVREVGNGAQVRTVLSMASVVEPQWVMEELAGHLESRLEVRWDDAARSVRQMRVRAIGGVNLEEKQEGDPAPDEAAEVFVERIENGLLRLEKWADEAEPWIARVRCAAEWFPERGLLKYEPEDLHLIYHELATGCVRESELHRRDAAAVVRGVLSWEDQQFVEQMAPDSLQLQGGLRVRLVYEPGLPPVARAKIQQLYGVEQTPKVAAGRQLVLLEILAPNQRPVQRTMDLASFWANTYPELKKELKRRYPKHEWR